MIAFNSLETEKQISKIVHQDYFTNLSKSSNSKMLFEL